MVFDPFTYIKSYFLSLSKSLKLTFEYSAFYAILRLYQSESTLFSIIRKLGRFGRRLARCGGIAVKRTPSFINFAHALSDLQSHNQKTFEVSFKP